MSLRYSKVTRRMWGDEKFCAMTPIPPCGQGLWLRLLTGPELGVIPGLFAAREKGLAEALGWETEPFRVAFAEGSSRGMVEADWRAGLVWVPRAIYHNDPESPNVVRSWRSAWIELPDSRLKATAYRGLKAYMEGRGKGYPQAFAEAFGTLAPTPPPNQEQEQEQEIPPGGQAPLALVPPPSPRAKRTKKTVKPEEPAGVAWRVWRATYLASRRRYGDYTQGTGDGSRVARIAAHAVELLADAGRATELEPLLGHWFRAYLRDDGSKSFPLAAKRHGLQWFEQGIPTYGVPWANGSAAEGVELGSGADALAFMDAAGKAR